jgi:hypothetical protein
MLILEGFLPEPISMRRGRLYPPAQGCKPPLRSFSDQIGKLQCEPALSDENLAIALIFALNLQIELTENSHG